jgi:orotate phosphoribosyltransferase
MQRKALDILMDTSAIEKGHFKLSSGLHSDTYVQCARVFEYPKYSSAICEMLADKLGQITVNTVIGPAMGGIIFAYELSRTLGVRNIFAERKDGEMTFRRGFHVEPGEPVLVAEDVVTTGGSAVEVCRLADEMGANVFGFCSIVDRSGGKIDFPYNYTSLIELAIDTYEPEVCPLCRDGIPINSPGSRHKK